MVAPKNKRKSDLKLLSRIRDLPCCVCGFKPSDASHIKTRGSGGPDEEWNVVPHCRKHHTEWGMSWSKFIKKYPQMFFLLKRMGWEVQIGISPQFNELWHPKISRDEDS